LHADTKRLGALFRGEVNGDLATLGTADPLQVFIDAQPVVWDRHVEGRHWPRERQLMSSLRALRTELEHSEKPRRLDTLARISALEPCIRALLAWLRLAFNEDEPELVPPVFRITTERVPANRVGFASTLHPTFEGNLSKPSSQRATSLQQKSSKASTAAAVKRAGAATAADEVAKRTRRNDPLAPLFAGGGARSSAHASTYPVFRCRLLQCFG
jgi:hypothetical protein